MQIQPTPDSSRLIPPKLPSSEALPTAMGRPDTLTPAGSQATQPILALSSLAIQDPLSVHPPAQISGGLPAETHNAFYYVAEMMTAYAASQNTSANAMLTVNENLGISLNTTTADLFVTTTGVNNLQTDLKNLEDHHPFRYVTQALMLVASAAFGFLIGGPVGAVIAASGTAFNDSMTDAGGWDAISTGSAAGNAAIKFGFSMVIGLLSGSALGAGDALFSSATEEVGGEAAAGMGAKPQPSEGLEEPSSEGPEEEEKIGPSAGIEEPSSSPTSSAEKEVAEARSVTETETTGTEKESIKERGKVGGAGEAEPTGAWAAAKRIAGNLWDKIPTLKPTTAIGLKNGIETLASFKTSKGKEKDTGAIGDLVLAFGGSQKAAAIVQFSLMSVIELANIAVVYKAAGDESTLTTKTGLATVLRYSSLITNIGSAAVSITSGSYDIIVSEKLRDKLAPLTEEMDREQGQVQIIQEEQQSISNSFSALIKTQEGWGEAVSGLLQSFFEPIYTSFSTPG